ncbi:putative DNA-binding protein [Rhodococcus qingshengii]|nr:helix-turn-helix transcriptional regulator [Rhodococcus qingshengii]BCF81655.1 putative DNA-binding protein [Rhodococcus qingshengii]
MPNIDESARAWQTEGSSRVGRAIAAAREELGLTAVDLANRTRELGFPISRVAISKIENNSRAGKLDVAELVVLSRALNVPPLALIYPDLPDGEVELWPGQQARSIVAAMWFSGEGNVATVMTHAGEKVDRATRDAADKGAERLVDSRRYMDLRYVQRMVRLEIAKARVEEDETTLALRRQELIALDELQNDLVERMTDRGWPVDDIG